MRAAGGLALLLAAGACSPLTQVYQRAGYQTTAAGHPVKRIAVGAWAPHGEPGLAPLLAEEARDLIKLRKNYLVLAAAPIARDWAELCHERVEGVLLLRPLAGPEAQGDAVALQLGAELYACADGDLLWRAAAGGHSRAADPDLAQLTASYQQSSGAAAQRLAAPAFVLLQPLVRALPDPELDDADVQEKIELE